MLTYFLCWFGMLLIAILNGTARDLWYKKYMGELKAHQLSTITFIIFLGIYIGFVVKRFSPGSGAKALLVGMLWLILTLIFEFGFGIMRGNSMRKLLGDYNILKGRLWILIPIWLLIAPYIFYRLYH